MKQNPCKQSKKPCEKSSFSFPSNQMSSKMLQSQMIRTNTKTTYNNSRITTIYSNILTLDYETNRNMVIQYKYACYMRYYTNLLQGNIPQSTRTTLSQLLNSIIANLTEEEYNHAFQIEPPAPPPLPKMLTESGYTFYVVTRITSTRTYFIFKNLPQNLLLQNNFYYTFDLSDPSNLNTKLSFSEEDNTGTPYRGVHYVSTPGTLGSKMIINVYNDIMTLKLYTFNDVRMFVNLKYIWGYSMKGLLTNLSQVKPATTTNLYLYTRQNSVLSIYDASGPKYAINDFIEPILFSQFNQYHYKFTYGTYYIEIQEAFAATLLNKGYEDCVSFIGDNDKKSIGNVYGVNYVEGPPKEGQYNFYYGRVKITVYKPFPFAMSIYSKEYGFMGGAELFYFTEESKENPETDVIPLEQYSLNVLTMPAMLRFNGDISNTIKRKYGLNYGKYILSIPPYLPITFMNYNKEDVFRVITTPQTVTSGPFTAPDGNNYTFYTGFVTIHITGNYEKISICTKNGYSGGYHMFVYTPYYGAPLPSIYKSFQGISALRVQTNLTSYEDTTQGTVLNFNEESTLKYGLYKGVYFIFNIPRKYPITLLNRGKESLVTLESITKTTLQGFGPDDTPYLFYYGILKMTVHGNFGFMTLYTLYYDYMGGYKKFSYDSLYDNRDSYPDPLSVPVISSVASNTTFTEVKISDKLTNTLISFSDNFNIDYGNLWDGEYQVNTLYVGSRVSFNPDSTLRIRYRLNRGIYILTSGTQYITLLNKGKESFISLIGNLSRKAIASDGNEYTFYTGSMIALYVRGTFDIMSLEVLGGPLEKGLFVQNNPV